jgi:hypothetical protein
MAKAFQRMLERFGLTERILGVNADNASANDKQTTKLSSFDNSFKEEYRARCFNHTTQLSAKTLLKPFNTALSGGAADEVDMTDEDDDLPILEADEDGEEERDEDEDEAEEDEDQDDEDDGIDELETLSEEERTQVLEDTAAVRATVTKVRTHEVIMFTFLIIGISTGTTTFFRNHSFNDNRSACLASNLLRTRPQSEAYPTRCGNAMEFHLRNDEFCAQIQARYRSSHRRQSLEAEEV